MFENNQDLLIGSKYYDMFSVKKKLFQPESDFQAQVSVPQESSIAFL